MSRLLDAIYADLADDGPRLVYADQLQDAGDPRGELIAVQCELARLGYEVKPSSWDWIGDALADDQVDLAHVRKLRAREKALLDEHREGWLAPARGLDLATSAFRFQRGFVAHCETNAGPDIADELAAVAGAFPTLESVGLFSIPRPHIRDAFAWSGVARLRALVIPLHGVEGLVGLRDAELRELSLRLADRKDIPTLQLLFGSTVLAKVTALELSQIPLTAADAGKLVAACGPLDELQLRGGKLGIKGAELLAKQKPLAGLRILSVLGNGVGPEGTRALMALRTLRALDLRKNRIGVDGCEALGGHPALRTLDLTGNSLDAEAIEALCGGSGLGELRELCLQATRLDDDGVAALATSPLLGRLTALSLRSNQITDTGAQALAKSKHATNLRALNLNNNKITAAGKAALDGSKYLAKARISVR